MTEVAICNHTGDLNLSKEHPHSPITATSTSSRRELPRLSGLGNASDHPAPTPPLPRLTRKRAASLNTQAANHPRMEDLALTSASPISTGLGGEKVCLCQPDPKIPRPRNAFILYRQHYQAQVVALHPGLANPEISKIIGEQWRDQPIEVKNEWKRLAEEEKHRHQQQYPDYRYQPRRAGTPSRSRRVSSNEDPIRCSKCNGRYISTAGSTPSTPFTPSSGGRNDRLLPPFTPLSSGTPPGNMTRDDRTQFSGAVMNTPRTAPLHQQIQRHLIHTYPNPTALRLGSPREHQDDMEMLDASPEFKRRRFNSGPQNQLTLSPYDSAQQRSNRVPMSAVGYIDDRRGPLPGPGALVHHQRGGMMEPPPRPSPIMHQFSTIQTPHSFDESLRLPPLQTHGANAGYGTGHPNPHHRADSQARSVEAMVMTIPYMNKIKVLAKISLPLAPAGPTSPVQEVRGIVIAVEGGEMQLVAEVGSFLEDCLNRESECLVKTWLSSSGRSKEKNAVDDSEMGGTNTPPVETPNLDNPFLDYLKTVQSWHERSAEISKYITTLPSTPTSPAAVSTPACSIASALAPISPPAASAPVFAPQTHNASYPARNKIPVALLPNGFSLSISDHYASSIPINDAYAPVDHWQWMATLWRGIIGPDLTVYVKHVNMEERDAGEEMAKFGGVEVRRDCPAVIVRVPIGNEDKVAENEKRACSKVEEKTLRRLGFEVIEIVRGGMAGLDGRAGFGRP